MLVGNLVKHKYGTLQGTGLVLEVLPYDPAWDRPGQQRFRVLWTAHGKSHVHTINDTYLQVISSPYGDKNGN
mgnify:CR=1 FL=1